MFPVSVSSRLVSVTLGMTVIDRVTVREQAIREILRNSGQISGSDKGVSR